jgi:predicted transcriptional regulator
MVTSVRLPDELERAVLAYAERHEVSKSTAMRLLMENGLAREDLASDVTDLEDRLDAMEETLANVAGTVDRIQSALDANSLDAGPLDGEEGSADTPDPLSEPPAVTTIPGGPDAPPETPSTTDGTTEQVAIGQWNDGNDGATPEEVTDGGQPTEAPSTEQP